MIKEMKDLLQETVERRCPGVPVVRSKSEMERAFMGRNLPLIALITNPGRFDDRESKIVRWYDEASQTWKQRYVRGNRSVPILLYCWGKDEEETDGLFSRILPAIPRQWKYDGFDGLVLIEREEHSDHADSLSKVYASAAEIRFTVFSALEEEAIPTITESEKSNRGHPGCKEHIMEEIEYTGSPPDTDAAVLLPIEEHAARQGVSPSILAAVVQGRHWAGGKQVSEAEFKGAVTTFLRGSMSGFKGR